MRPRRPVHRTGIRRADMPLEAAGRSHPAAAEAAGRHRPEAAGGSHPAAEAGSHRPAAEAAGSHPAVEAGSHTAEAAGSHPAEAVDSHPAEAAGSLLPAALAESIPSEQLPEAAGGTHPAAAAQCTPSADWRRAECLPSVGPSSFVPPSDVDVVFLVTTVNYTYNEMNGAIGTLRITNQMHTTVKATGAAQRQCCQLVMCRPTTRP